MTMTTTTTTEVQSKRDERMSDYHRDIDQLGELPNAEELAGPIVKAMFDLVEAFSGPGDPRASVRVRWRLS